MRLRALRERDERSGVEVSTAVLLADPSTPAWVDAVREVRTEYPRVGLIVLLARPSYLAQRLWLKRPWPERPGVPLANGIVTLASPTGDMVDAVRLAAAPHGKPVTGSTPRPGIPSGLHDVSRRARRRYESARTRPSGTDCSCSHPAESSPSGSPNCSESGSPRSPKSCAYCEGIFAACRARDGFHAELLARSFGAAADIREFATGAFDVEGRQVELSIYTTGRDVPRQPLHAHITAYLRAYQWSRWSRRA